MKIAVGLAILAVAMATSHMELWNQYEDKYEETRNVRLEDSAFRPGREYKYKYDGQIMNGIPHASKQHSATRIQAIVTIQFQSPENVLLKLEHIRMGKLNDKVFEPRLKLPFRAFEPVEIAEEQKQILDKTCRFQYLDGLVKNIEWDEQEESWSANIKRGVLNMLQVNLRQHDATDSSDDMMLTNSFEPTQSAGQANFYRVMEKSLEGECETIYSVTKLPRTQRALFQDSSLEQDDEQYEIDSEATKSFNVTKSVNFEKCNRRPQIKYNQRFEEDCQSCENKYQDEEKFLKSSSIIKFNLAGNRQRFLIEKARGQSQYTIQYYGESGSFINVYVNQTLEIFKSGAISAQLSAPMNPRESKSKMVYSLNWDIMKEQFQMESEELFHDKTPYSKVENKIQLVDKIIAELAQTSGNGQESLDSVAPRLWSRLVTVFRMLKLEQIEEIHQKYYQSEPGMPEHELKFIRGVLEQACAAAGTEPCIKHITDVIKQREVSTLKATSLLRQLQIARVVSEKSVQHVKQLCQEPTIQDSFALKQACYLSLGSLMRAACQPHTDKLAVDVGMPNSQVHARCSQEDKKEYVDFLIQKVEEGRTWETKVMYLKALSNAGLDLSVYPLEKIIQNQEHHYPIYVRVEAIKALRQLKTIMPLKIQRILMPIFMNIREPTFLRQTAAYMLLHSQPEAPLLKMMAAKLNNEPKRQVVLFTRAVMEEMANSTNPCYKKLSADLKLALRLVKRQPTYLYDSKFMHSSFHSWSEKIGLDINTKNIMSNDSLVPRQLSMNLASNFFGYFQPNFLSASLVMQGLEPILEQLYGPMGSEMRQSLGEVLRRAPRSVGQYQSEIQEVFSQLNTRIRDTPSQEPKAYASFRFQNQEYGMIPLSVETIQSAVEDGFLSMRQIERFLQSGETKQVDLAHATMLAESQWKIPTTIGLPLVIKHKVPAVMKVQGSIKALLSEDSSSINIATDLKPSIVAKSILTCEIWSPIVNSGVKVSTKVKAFLPIKAQIKAFWRQSQPELVVSFEPPTEERELLTLESTPVTFTRVWPTRLQEWNAADERIVHAEEMHRVENLDKTLKTTFGLRFKVLGKYHPFQSSKWMPKFPLDGHNCLSIYAMPGQDRPEQIELKINGKTHRMNEPFSSNLRREHFEEMSRESQFETEYSSQSYKNLEFNVELAAKGGQERKVVLSVKNKFSPENRLNKFQAEFYSSSIEEQNGQPIKVCLESETLFPSIPHSESNLEDKKVVQKAQVNWGQSCESQNFISLTATAERSREQKEYEQRESSEYRQCMKQESEVECRRYMEKASSLNKYNVHIKYNNVPVFVKNATAKMFRAIKSYYYYTTDVASIDVENPEHEITAVLRMDPANHRRMNVTVKTPRENVTMIDLKTPFRFPRMNLRKSFWRSGFSDIMSQNLQKDDYTYESEPTCRIGRTQCKTFDGKEFQGKLTPCWTVLAKDCTERQRFVVMAKKQSPESNEKVLKILTHSNKIVLEKEGSELKVLINDQPVEIRTEESVYQAGEEIAKVVKRGSMLRVRLPEVGLKIDFDGEAVEIKMSPHYVNQVCGICGHFNYEPEDTFRTPENRYESRIPAFIAKYTVKTSECEAELERMQERSERSYESSIEEKSEESMEDEQTTSYNKRLQRHRVSSPRRVTKVIQRSGKTCFSKHARPICADNAYPKDAEEKEIKYVCLESEEHRSMDFSHRAHRLEILSDELERLPVAFTRREVVPIRCQKN